VVHAEEERNILDIAGHLQLERRDAERDDDKENDTLLSNVSLQRRQSSGHLMVSSPSSTSDASSSMSMENENDILPSPRSPRSSKVDMANDADTEEMDGDELDRADSDSGSASSSSNEDQSTSTSTSQSASMSPSSTSSDDSLERSTQRKSARTTLKKKVVIPLLPLDQIKDSRIQSNIGDGSFGTNPSSLSISKCPGNRGMRRDSLKGFTRRPLPMEDTTTSTHSHSEQRRGDHHRSTEPVAVGGDDNDNDEDEEIGSAAARNGEELVSTKAVAGNTVKDRVGLIDSLEAVAGFTALENGKCLEAMDESDQLSFGEEVDERGYDVDDEREESSELLVDAEQLELLNLSPIHCIKGSVQKDQNAKTSTDTARAAEQEELDEIIRNHEEKRKAHRQIIEEDIDPLDDDDDEDEDVEDQNQNENEVKEEEEVNEKRNGRNVFTEPPAEQRKDLREVVATATDEESGKDLGDDGWFNQDIGENVSPLGVDGDGDGRGVDADPAMKPDLKYIDSFLQSISTLSISKCASDLTALDTNQISVTIDSPTDSPVTKVDGAQRREEEQPTEQLQGLSEEKLESFRRSNLKDFLVDAPRVTARKKGWWMKYLNSDMHDTSD